MPSDHSKKNGKCAATESKKRGMPPPAGWCKINVDGSFVMDTGKAGVGVIVRDAEGQAVFTAWRAPDRCRDAAEAEALACVEGIRLTSQWTPGRVIIEFAPGLFMLFGRAATDQ